MTDSEIDEHESKKEKCINGIGQSNENNLDHHDETNDEEDDEVLFLDETQSTKSLTLKMTSKLMLKKQKKMGIMMPKKKETKHMRKRNTAGNKKPTGVKDIRDFFPTLL